MAEARALKRFLKNMESIREQVLLFNKTTPIATIGANQDLLNDQWIEFQALEKLLKGKFDEANLELVAKVEEIRFEVMKSLFNWARVNEAQQREQNKSTMDEFLMNQTNFMHDISTISKREHEIRLPRVNIPTFGGVYAEFPSFMDLFETSIHNSADISKVHKMQYLKGLLKGEAFSLINHLSVTEANYEEAWTKLKLRYNKPKLIVQGLLKRFMEQSSMPHCSSKALRHIVDVSDEITRGLRVLGEKAESRDPWLIYILVNKLDGDTKEAWAHQTAENDFPTLKEFFEFLTKRSDAMESLDSMTKVRTSQTRKVTALISQTESCPLCTGGYYLGVCDKYLALSVLARKQVVAEKKLCFNCMSSKHQAKMCRSRYNCQKCKRRHHLTLHHEEEEKREETAKSSTLSAVAQLTTINNFAILPTVIITVRNKLGELKRCRALLDSGSQVSLVSEGLVQLLRLPRSKAYTSIRGISTGIVRSGGRIAMVLGSLYNPNIQIEIDALILSKLPPNIPSYDLNMEDIPSVKGIQLADPDFHIAAPIDIVIGADNFFAILEEERRKMGLIFLQKTVFGWVVSGQIKSTTLNNEINNYAERNVFSIAVSEQQGEDVDKTLRQFWEMEDSPQVNHTSPEEAKCEQIYADTFKRRDDGRYVVRLPFRDMSTKLGNSFKVAARRFCSLERRLINDEDLRKQYVGQMREYLQRGHMVEISNDQINIGERDAFYLPHHAVVKATSETTKLRVVFDGSSKSTTGVSLNDTLLIGPTIQPTLWATLLRFRCHRIVIAADIERMYHQILINDDDTNYQRLLWREDPGERMRHCKLTTVTFGLACSAYLAIRTLQQLARESEDNTVLQHIVKDFYVDDFLSGAESEEGALLLKRKISTTLQQGGFTLRKWKSNSPSLSDQSKDLATGPVCGEMSTSITILGLHWHANDDLFTFKINSQPEGPITKRRVISETARVFDPLGFLAPSIVLLKIFIAWLSE